MRAAGVDAQAVALGELGDHGVDRLVPDEERLPFRAVVAEHDVLGDRERADEAEVLVHHADAFVERVARRVEVHRLAVEEDLALVRPVEAREDVGEGRLAGAVLAEQRVHLARAPPRSARPRSRRRPGSAS